MRRRAAAATRWLSIPLTFNRKGKWLASGSDSDTRVIILRGARGFVMEAVRRCDAGSVTRPGFHGPTRRWPVSAMDSPGLSSGLPASGCDRTPGLQHHSGLPSKRSTPAQETLPRELLILLFVHPLQVDRALPPDEL
jgi:hypothetical protein